MPSQIVPQAGAYPINAHRRAVSGYTNSSIEDPNLPPISKGIKVSLKANTQIPCEIYEPETTNEKKSNLNTLFYFPGTASQSHAPQVTTKIAGTICKVMECRVIVPYHRLAPENKYPTPDNDVTGVIQQLLDDPTLELNKIALGGHSSGGLLALNFCLNNPTITINQLLLIAPVVDLDACTRLTTDPSKQQVEPAFFKAFVNQYLPSYQEPGKPEVSPFHHTQEALAALPPIIMVSGGDDILLPSIKAFLEKANKHGAPHSQLEVVPGKNHYLAWQSGEYMKDIKAFFQENFSQERGAIPKNSVKLNIRPTCEETYLGIPPFFTHANYVHREALETTIQASLQEHHLIAYTGASGKGKTQLALYHYYMLPNYKYRLWIDCSTDETLRLSFSALDQILRLPSNKEYSLPEKIAYIKKWLGLQRDGDCLIIFDNAQSMAQINNYLPKNIDVIVTSLNEQEKWPFKILVNKLTLDERKQFLPSDNNELLTLLGESVSPLALQLAKKYVSNTRIADSAVTNFVSAYTQYQCRDPESTPEEICLSLCLSNLASKARETLELCALLAPSNIPYKSLLQIDISTLVKLDVYPFFIEDSFTDNLSLHHLIQQLIRESLLKNKNRSISLINHILQKFKQHQAFNEDDNNHGRLIPHVASLITFVKDNNLMQHVNLTDFVMLGFNWACMRARYLSDKNSAIILKKHYEIYKKYKRPCQTDWELEYRYNYSMSHAAWERGNHIEGLTSCKEMIALCSAPKSPLDKRKEAAANHHAGVFYNKLGELELAKEHLRKAAEIYSLINDKNEIKLPDVINWGRAFLMLSCVENSKKEYALARSHCKQAQNVFTLCQQNPKEHNTFLILYYEIMGHTYLEENLEKAKNLFQESLKHRLNIYGKKHRLVAQTYIALGVSCETLDEAVYYFRKSSKILLDLYDENENAYIGDYCWYVAKTLLKFNQKENAKDFLLESLRIRKLTLQEKLPEEHYKTLQVKKLIKENFQNDFQVEKHPMITRVQLKEIFTHQHLHPLTEHKTRNPCTFFAGATAGAALGVAGCLATQYLLSS